MHVSKRLRKSVRIDLNAHMADPVEHPELLEDSFGDPHEYAAQRLDEWHTEGVQTGFVRPVWPILVLLPAIGLFASSLWFGSVWLAVGGGPISWLVLLPSLVMMSYAPIGYGVISETRSRVKRIAAAIACLVCPLIVVSLLAKAFPHLVNGDPMILVWGLGLGAAGICVATPFGMFGEYTSRPRHDKAWVREFKKLAYHSAGFRTSDISRVVGELDMEREGRSFQDAYGTPVEKFLEYEDADHNGDDGVNDYATLAMLLLISVPSMMGLHAGVGGQHREMYCGSTLLIVFFVLVLTVVPYRRQR